MKTNDFWGDGSPRFDVADNVAVMRKIVCNLLIVWLVLMSGSVAAHATIEAAHDVGHAATHALAQDAGSDETSHTNADHPDTCNQSHCNYAQNPGLFASLKTCPKTEATSNAPRASNIWASSALRNNIERPKWPHATPAVVSLLT